MDIQDQWKAVNLAKNITKINGTTLKRTQQTKETTITNQNFQPTQRISKLSYTEYQQLLF